MKLAESFHSYNHPSNELLVILASTIMRNAKIDAVDIKILEQEILLNPKLPIYKISTGLSSFSDDFLMKKNNKMIKMLSRFQKMININQVMKKDIKWV